MSDAAPNDSDRLSQQNVDATLNAAQDPAGSEASSLPGESPADEKAPVSRSGALDGGTAPKKQDGSDSPESASASEARSEQGVGEPSGQAVANTAPAEAPVAESSQETLSPAPADSMPLEIPELSQVPASTPVSEGVKLLSNVDLHVKVELGRAEMAIEDVLRLGSGSVVELDKLAGDPVDVLVNDRLVARGEVLILNDNFCVRISEITSELESEELVES